MGATLYRIRRWEENFETAESRRLQGLRWVAVPNKHDGKSFRRLGRMEDAGAIYGAWQLMLQVASKMPIRGTLCDDDGPITAADLEDKTGFPEALFARAIETLMGERIGWIEVVEGKEAARIIEETRQSLFSPNKRRPSPATPGTSQQHPARPCNTRHVPATPIGINGPAGTAQQFREIAGPPQQRTADGWARPALAGARGRTSHNITDRT